MTYTPEYKEGYNAFTEDKGGFMAQAVQRHFSGERKLDKPDDWFTGYADAEQDHKELWGWMA